MNNQTIPEEIEVTASVLDLTASEKKALSAVLILLDRTGYHGNRPVVELDSKTFRFKGILPQLEVTYSQYFEAYGLEKAGDQYQVHQVQEALDALWSLVTTPRVIYYERKRWTGSGRNRRQVSDFIFAEEPLINLMEIIEYKGLEQEEAKRVKVGHDIPEKIRASVFLIEFPHLHVGSIDNSFILKPT